MKKTAIILGATGLTGNIILQKLIKDDRYEAIKLFSRSKIEGLPNKVTQYIGDLLKLEEFKTDFTADEVYCCIGTTANKTPHKTTYHQIDYGIPVAAAKLSKENDIPRFFVISAIGADINSSVFYNKTKGEMEQEVLLQKIENTAVFRPALIGGDRKEKRALEKIATIFFKIINPLLFGPIEQYRMINAENIALAMIKVANNETNADVIITSNNIRRIAENN